MAAPRPSDVWRLGDAVTPEEKLVLLALVDYGTRIHPSQGTLALKTGFCIRTIRTIVASLRRKGLISTSQRGAKSLDYVVRLERPECGKPCRVDAANRAGVTGQAVPINEAGDAAQCGKPCRGILTSQGTSQPNQPPATPSGGVGWQVSWEVRTRIALVDRHADVDRNVGVLAKQLVSEGFEPTEVRAWVDALCASWARTGQDAYSTYVGRTQGLDGARDRRAVIRSRLREVAA